MSNFTCNMCRIPLIDSKKGYISGCQHYDPDKYGKYRCMVQTKQEEGIITAAFTTVIFNEDGWQLDKNQKLLDWKLIE